MSPSTTANPYALQVSISSAKDEERTEAERKRREIRGKFVLPEKFETDGSWRCFRKRPHSSQVNKLHLRKLQYTFILKI